ncbi:hypothetical protein [Pseudomonas sp. NFACC13-1]|uniref:hypothetical protein n=1 Tax=Pseudomonas sp. NFACC13-1 TaxID=1566245 RepID=UPI00115F93B5|nr:hypothetical protein [Pseudomonas sp. NFACC13-1]
MKPIKVEHARYSSKTPMVGTHRTPPGISNGKCTEASIGGEVFFLHFATQRNLTQTEALPKQFAGKYQLGEAHYRHAQTSTSVLLRRNQCVTAWGRE